MPWADCYYEDRGDGAVIVVPPTIATARVVDPLIPELASRLRQYNRRASEVVRIQLRVALHVGPVGRDPEGLTGEAIIIAARILDAPALKVRLAADQADLMFAASDYVYDHVIRHCVGKADSAAFEHVDYQVKKTRVPDTLTSRQDVARMIGVQDRPAEAEQLTRDVLADRTRVLGAGHPDTETTRNELAQL